MSYDAEETSVESGQPVELYEIRLGVDVFRYASGEDDIVVSANTWTAIPLKRSSIPISPEARTQPIEVTMPASNTFAQKYVASIPVSQATLQIFRVHRGDLTDTVLLFKGVVKTVKPVEGALAKAMPRIDFGAQCSHMLYDARCKVAPGAFRYQGTVATVSGSTITVTGLDGSKGVGWATAGEVVRANGDRRLIIRHTATDTLQLLFPFEDTPLGETVDVFAGCDHSLATCQSKFANELNFGGTPFVPNKNPFITGLD
jgi:uncharacterized phage protein (TIGR02218 family)